MTVPPRVAVFKDGCYRGGNHAPLAAQLIHHWHREGGQQGSCSLQTSGGGCWVPGGRNRVFPAAAESVCFLPFWVNAYPAQVLADSTTEVDTRESMIFQSQNDRALYLSLVWLVSDQGSRSSY